jgi:hypothetical protein
MPDIVISYRRSDSAAMAGRIRDCLAREYGEEAVYMDVESIPSGAEDYRIHIRKAIRDAKVLIAVIGPKWRGPKRGGASRILQTTDTVRAELEAALECRIPIIPVLVDDAPMPAEKEFPESLKSLAFANAAKVAADQDFHDHMNRLIRAINHMLDGNGAAGPASSTWHRVARQVRRRAFLGPIGAAGCAAVLGALWFHLSRDEPSAATDRSSHTAGTSYVPPSPRSHWQVGTSRQVGTSVVFLEAAGPVRQFYFVKPSPELATLGAEPGTLLFEGRKDGDKYQGRAFVFAGRCGKFPYDVHGDVLNEQRTVDLRGRAPRIDVAVCKQAEWEDQRLVFDFTERK